MGSSIFNLKGYNNALWNINPIGMTLNAGTSTINGTSTVGSGGNFYGGGLTYYNLSFADSAAIFDNNTFHDVAFVSDGFISGNNSFNDVSFFLHAIINGHNIFNNVTMGGNGIINGSNTFNNLTFSPWWTYTLQAGATQTIGNICAQGTGALPIRIQSSIAGTPAIISKAGGSICWDYVYVSDITATGGATFNAGLAPANSQDLGGNTGLLFTGGCTALSCLLSCTPPSITTQPINSSVCLGSNAVFTITATGTDLTYQWQVNQGLGFINLNNIAPYSGVTSNTLTIIAPAILFNGYQYRCAAVGACPIVSMSDAVTLIVKSLPTVTVNSAIICSGQTAILTASAGTVFVPVAHLLPPSPPLPPPPTTTSYIWSTGETTDSISVAPTTTTSYTVTGTTNGCSGTAISTVTVNPAPIVSATVSSSTVTVSATGGTPPYAGTGIFTGLAPGTYSYTITDANGCSGSATVTVNLLPISSFNISADTIYAGNSLTFTNNSTGFSPTTKFAWNFGDFCFDNLNTSPMISASGHICIDTTIGANQQITHVYNEDGTYNIIMTAKDNLGNEFTMTKSVSIISSIATSACNSGTNCDLICNGGFENSSCAQEFVPFSPTMYQLGYSRVDYWSNLHPSSGTSPSATPDYYDNKTCPKPSGNGYNNTADVPNNMVGCLLGHNNSQAYIGLITYTTDGVDYREYATSQLNTTMIANKIYKVTYYVGLADICKFGTTAPSAYFTTNGPPTQAPFGTVNNVVTANNSYLANANSYGIITDKIGWKQIELYYPATGNENYITIGNFNNDANTQKTSSGLSSDICSNILNTNTGVNEESYMLSHYSTIGNMAYYYIDDVSIVPVNPITLTASQTTICSGQTVTLTATGGNGTYTWTSTSGNVSGTASTINVNPTTTNIITNTTYTVTSYNTTFGCYFSQSITITVNPLPALSTSGNVAICSGASTTLTATGTGIFYWNTGATTTSIMVSPISSTNYTVTLTDAGGCINSSTIIVSIIPTPSFQVSGSTSSCDASNYSVPYQPGVIYNWSTTTGSQGTGTSSNTNFNPSGGTITFIGTYGGCSSSSSLYVGSCCNPTNNNVPNMINTIASALVPYGTTTGGVLKVTNKQFSINGTFYVDKNLTLEGCTVTMGYLAKIIVIAGFTLTITDFHTDKSHLYACNEMWDGIHVPNSSSRLIIDNGTTIEDAINAVFSDNRGDFQISSSATYGNVIFNKNYKSIVVNNSDGLTIPHPGTISSTTIQCYDGVVGGNQANTNDKLHYPHATERSDVGIEIAGVSDITIGKPTNTAFVNTFDNLDNGIRTYFASVNVYNNNFQNITSPGSPPNGECFSGVAICAEGEDYLSIIRTLKVGSNLPSSSYRNTFFNCYRGIAVNKSLNAEILNNTFTDGNPAIRMAGNYERTLTVNKNTIGSAAIGIDSYNNIGSTITINSNVIDAPLPAYAQGIRAGEVILSSSTDYIINDNIISNVQYGINASGLSTSTINTNTVNVLNYSFSQPSFGVSLTASIGCLVVGNVVGGQGGSDLSNDYWVNGIYLVNCANDIVACNQSNSIGAGLFFGGVQGPATVIEKNVMNHNLLGLVLYYGYVGQQGTIGNPNDNRWLGTFLYHTYSLNSVGANSPFYVRKLLPPFLLPTSYNPGSTYSGFSNSGPSGFILLNPTIGNLNNLPCPIIPPGGGGGPRARAMALQIAGDSIVPVVHIASTKSMLQQSLYSYLQTDSTLASTEPLIAQFKAYHTQHNLGKLAATSTILSNPLSYNVSTLQSAQTLNNAISPSSDAETNSQWMNTLLIDNALTSIGYTATQLSDLRVLAAKCPYSDGNAVFQARTILSQYDTIVYGNECETFIPHNQKSMILQQQEKDTINTAFKLYPNPNNGTMLLDYTLNTTDKGEIKIYDIAGKLIYKYNLDASANQIIISHEEFNNSIYFYKISVNDKIIKTDKLLIIK